MHMEKRQSLSVFFVFLCSDRRSEMCGPGQQEQIISRL